ncbi:MAG: DUF1700 domain-containing protein [Clostridia bacterium]|nr:DUF1700 domain-containing protein [Clostridia bacterium]
MKQIEWEKKFLDGLESLPEAERYKIAEYYREMYGDKLEAGQSSDDILAEFGDPKECAERILQENENTDEEVALESEREKEVVSHQKEEVMSVEKKERYWTPATIVGMAFLTLLLIIPLASGALSVITALGSLALAGVIVALAGVVYVIIAPFMGLSGVAFSGIIAHLGMGFLCCGLGILLCIGFFFVTKYAILGCWKALVWIYKRGR